MKMFSFNKHWLIIVILSLLSALLFTFTRQNEIHYIFGFYLSKYFGYGLEAFLTSLPIFLLGYVLLYFLIRVFTRGGLINRTLIGSLIVIILLYPIYSRPFANVIEIPPLQPSMANTETYYVVFSFDTEKGDTYDINSYYNRYNYITSGAFYKLVDLLDERNISATFYVTPDLAKDIPEIPTYLESEGQDIGVHLHPNALLDLNFPYHVPFIPSKGDEIAIYNYSEKMTLMKRAKEDVEEAVGHQVLLYRSGRFSCDSEVEKIASYLGYEAIANHRGIYFIEPFRIWNLGHGTLDILDPERFKNLGDYKALFESRAKLEHIIIFSGHPYMLYNHDKNHVEEGEINLFVQFIDYLKEKQDVEIINHSSLLDLLKDQ